VQVTHYTQTAIRTLLSRTVASKDASFFTSRRCSTSVTQLNVPRVIDNACDLVSDIVDDITRDVICKMIIRVYL